MKKLENYLSLLLEKGSLAHEEAKSAMQCLIQGENENSNLAAAFLSILKYRGPTPDEIAGMQRAIVEMAHPVSLPFPVLDIVGTGGDGQGTVNISTGASILAAACGIPVVKHGNRSLSSPCGSADVLEELGIDIEVPREEVQRSLQEAHIAFLFAPYYHPCLKQVRPLRRALGFSTIFNLLGPLLNPAQAEYALIGVSDRAHVELMAAAIVRLGRIKRALVFHGSGLDELTTLGPILAYEVYDGRHKPIDINPEDLGFETCSLDDLKGGSAVLNAALLKEVFAGKTGALSDALILNAAAALYIFNRASSLQEGISMARLALKEGKALKVLEKWTAFKPQKKKNYLEKILVHKKREVDELLTSKKGKFASALKQDSLAVIGEIKRRSPSRGALQEISDPVQLALEYCQGGASAISVLTDVHFDGKLDDLKRVCQVLDHLYPHVPVLRKDFIIHPIQLVESLNAGASAVLLIAKVLGADLKSFILEAKRLGLETLTEVHDAEDLALAIQAGATIIGINHRNLSTFEIDLNISRDLRPLIPSSILTVAESGIFTPADADTMRKREFDAVLVGEALVCSDNPAELIAQLKGGSGLI